MKVFVTGATGFIGGHIAKAALAAGWQVEGLRRDPNATGHLGAESSVHWHPGDLNDGASLCRAMQGSEILFHAAAYYPRRERSKTIAEHMAAARAEMESVLAAAKAAGIRRMVYTSTLTTIGNPPAGSSRLADGADSFSR